MKVQQLKADDIFKESQFHYASYTSLNNTIRLHSHDFYEIFVITSGSVYHIINNQKQLLHSNTIVFIRPEDKHYYEKTSEKVHYFNLAFTYQVMEKIINYVGKDFRDTIPGNMLANNIEYIKAGLTILSEKDKYLINSKINKINSLPQHEQSTIQFHYHSLLLELFSQLITGQEKELGEQIPDWLEKIYNHMRDKENFTVGIDKLYQLSGRSQEYTCRMFKKHFKQTPTEYINNLRLNYTANLLSKTDKKIIDLALEAGFNNLSHFYHLFNEKYQISPGQYRRKYRKDLV